MFKWFKFLSLMPGLVVCIFPLSAYAQLARVITDKRSIEIRA